MKKLIAAILAVLFLASSTGDTTPSSTMVEISDVALSEVSGQAGLNINATTIISGLQQVSSVANLIKPILTSQGKQVVTLINVAATTAPVVNNLVNGGQLSTADLTLLIKNGVSAGIAIGSLSSGL